VGRKARRAQTLVAKKRDRKLSNRTIEEPKKRSIADKAKNAIKIEITVRKEILRAVDFPVRCGAFHFLHRAGFLSLCQPSPVRAHFSSVMRHRFPSSAMRRKTKSGGQRQRLKRQAALDLFAYHLARLCPGCRPSGCELEYAKSDN
jgi:hypothetical protein